MNGQPPAATRALAAVLLAALLLRAPFLLFETPIGRDIAEYQNVADNLRSGQGFTLDIKAYHAADGERPDPASHPSGINRAPLLPLLLAAIDSVAPRGTASRVLPTALYLLALLLVFDLLRVRAGTRIAFWGGMLLAVQPALLGISLRPLTEVVTLFSLALALWAYGRVRSPALAGVACALGFLARPSAATFAIVLGAIYLVRAWREKAWRGPIVFGLAAASGPAVLAAINLASGLHPLLLPQGFLFRVISVYDGLHFIHEGPVYGSPGALLSAEAPEIARRILRNGFDYVSGLLGAGRGFGLALIALPWAALGLFSSPRRDLWIPLALFALADLALYTSTWAVFDLWRFMAVPLLCGTILIALGLLEAHDGGRDAPGAAPLMLATLTVVWMLAGVYGGYTALREHQIGRPLSSDLEAVWTGDDVDALESALAQLEASGALDARAVIASNEPWLLNRLADRPTVLLPWDLRPGEWLPLVEAHGAVLATIHGRDWPETHMRHRDGLRAELEAARWTLVMQEGEMELWRRPW